MAAVYAELTSGLTNIGLGIERAVTELCTARAVAREEARVARAEALAEAQAARAVASAEAQADRAEAQADRAEAQADRAEAQADRAEARVARAEALAEAQAARAVASAEAKADRAEARVAREALSRDLHQLLLALAGPSRSTAAPPPPILPISSPQPFSLMQASGSTTPSEGGGGGSGSASLSASGRNSPQGAARKASAAKGRLLAAFSSDATRTLSLPALPYPASCLLQNGVLFAHRFRTTSGVVYTDFTCSVGSDGIQLHPSNPAIGKPGMSFFITTCETPGVLQAAHTFRGDKVGVGGCHAYPIANLPATLSLVVDGVQVEDSSGAPVMLHASLAPHVAMSEADFLAALGTWQGVQPCSIEGRGDGGLEYWGSNGSSGAVTEEEEEEEEEVCTHECGEAARALALVAGAAAKLTTFSSLQVRSFLPAGGSPGTL